MKCRHNLNLNLENPSDTSWFPRVSLWCVQGRMQEQASSRERTQRVGRTAITGVTCVGSLLCQIDQGDPTQNRGDSYSLMKILLHYRPAFKNSTKRHHTNGNYNKEKPIWI
jgi:hypothetical protein